MAQTSYFWKANVTPSGDEANPYTDDEFTDFFSILNLHDRTDQGVLFTEHPDYSNLLAVSSTGGANVRVASGAAFVDGKMYYNTSNVDNNVSGATVYWVVGLRKDWAAQTVRVFARGNYASRALALASLVQTDGTTWEIPLATVLTTAGGNVDVITDERTFVFNMGAMVKIDSAFISPSVGNITFANIPQCFSSLYIIAALNVGGLGALGGFFVYFNNEIGQTYYYSLQSRLFGTDDDVDAVDWSAATAFLHDSASSLPGDSFTPVNIHITNYTSSVYYASYLAYLGTINNATAPSQNIVSGFHRNAVPITRIDLDGNFGVGSRATLYGMA